MAAKAALLRADATAAVSTANGNDVDRLKELECQLAAAQRERDDLARDVEALCMSSGDASGFSTSAVLSLRIRNTDRELSEAQEQLAAARAAASSLHEDNRALRESKRVADASWREERKRREELEKELAFYQQQSARAMGDRDKAVWEAEELRRQNLTFEEDARRLDGQRVEEASKREATEAMLASSREEVHQLQLQVAQVAEMPKLKDRVQQLQGECEGLRKDLATAQAEAVSCWQAVQVANAAVDEARKQAQASTEQLNATAAQARDAADKLEQEWDAMQAKFVSLQEQHASLQAAYEEQEAGLAAAQAELEVLRRATEQEIETERQEISGRVERAEAARREQIAAMERTLAETDVKLAEAGTELEELTRQKVAALLQLSEEQGRVSSLSEEASELKKQLQELKQQLAKARAAADAGGPAAAGKGGYGGTGRQAAKPARQGGLLAPR